MAKTMYEDALEGPDAKQLETISTLAAKQIALERLLDTANEDVKRISAALRKVQEQDLPDAMSAAGCKSFTMPDGRGITIKKDISASLAEGKKGPAIEWL